MQSHIKKSNFDFFVPVVQNVAKTVEISESAPNAKLPPCLGIYKVKTSNITNFLCVLISQAILFDFLITRAGTVLTYEMPSIGYVLLAGAFEEW